MTIEEAALAIGARIEGDPGVCFTSVCTDTRESPSGSLFFALKGENSDGHRFVERAFESGAAAAVVSEPSSAARQTLLVVPDTLRALGDLAAWYRSRFD